MTIVDYNIERDQFILHDDGRLSSLSVNGMRTVYEAVLNGESDVMYVYTTYAVHKLLILSLRKHGIDC